MLNFYGDYDVVVCGGGTSGCTAAICAARAGAKKVLLIERVGQLGGQMNFSGPPGFSFAHFLNYRQEQVIAGFAAETHKLLLEEGHALPDLRPRWRCNYTYAYVDPDWWGLLMYKMCKDEGVELMMHSLVTEVMREGNVVKGVICEHPGGKSLVTGKVIIDCTGEGEVAYQAGAEYEIAPRDILEPATVAFTADGVNWDEVMDYVRNHVEDFLFGQIGYENTDYMTLDKIREAVRNCKDVVEMGEVMGFLSLQKIGVENNEWHNQSGVGFFIMPKGDKILAHFQHSSQVDKVDCTDVRDISRAEAECREQNVIAFKFFKKYIPGFENAYITRVCPEVRIRETRRVMGDYKLLREDVMEARKFDDVIGKSAFTAGAKHAVGDAALALKDLVYPKDGGSTDIPYRCLVVKDLENFMVAGKAISTDRAAHHRFLQETIVTGQAAGVAAALCVRDGKTPRQLETDVSELQKILIEQGAILYGTH